MGVAPLQFSEGVNPETLGLDGTEIYRIDGLSIAGIKEVSVTAKPKDGGDPIIFRVKVRIDTPQEELYYEHGGILQYVLRNMINK